MVWIYLILVHLHNVYGKKGVLNRFGSPDSPNFQYPFYASFLSLRNDSSTIPLTPSKDELKKLHNKLIKLDVYNPISKIIPKNVTLSVEEKYEGRIYNVNISMEMYFTPDEVNKTKDKQLEYYNIINNKLKARCNSTYDTAIEKKAEWIMKWGMNKYHFFKSIKVKENGDIIISLEPLEVNDIDKIHNMDIRDNETLILLVKVDNVTEDKQPEQLVSNGKVQNIEHSEKPDISSIDHTNVDSQNLYNLLQEIDVPSGNSIPVPVKIYFPVKIKSSDVKWMCFNMVIFYGDNELDHLSTLTYPDVAVNVRKKLFKRLTKIGIISKLSKSFEFTLNLLLKWFYGNFSYDIANLSKKNPLITVRSHLIHKLHANTNIKDYIKSMNHDNKTIIEVSLIDNYNYMEFNADFSIPRYGSQFETPEGKTIHDAIVAIEHQDGNKITLSIRYLIKTNDTHVWFMYITEMYLTNDDLKKIGDTKEVNQNVLDVIQEKLLKRAQNISTIPNVPEWFAVISKVAIALTAGNYTKGTMYFDFEHKISNIMIENITEKALPNFDTFTSYVRNYSCKNGTIANFSINKDVKPNLPTASFTLKPSNYDFDVNTVPVMIVPKINEPSPFIIKPPAPLPIVKDNDEPGINTPNSGSETTPSATPSSTSDTTYNSPATDEANTTKDDDENDNLQVNPTEKLEPSDNGNNLADNQNPRPETDNTSDGSNTPNPELKNDPNSPDNNASRTDNPLESTKSDTDDEQEKVPKLQITEKPKEPIAPTVVTGLIQGIKLGKDKVALTMPSIEALINDLPSKDSEFVLNIDNIGLDTHTGQMWRRALIETGHIGEEDDVVEFLRSHKFNIQMTLYLLRKIYGDLARDSYTSYKLFYDTSNIPKDVVLSGDVDKIKDIYSKNVGVQITRIPPLIKSTSPNFIIPDVILSLTTHDLISRLQLMFSKWLDGSKSEDEVEKDVHLAIICSASAIFVQNWMDIQIDQGYELIGDDPAWLRLFSVMKNLPKNLSKSPATKICKKYISGAGSILSRGTQGLIAENKPKSLIGSLGNTLGINMSNSLEIANSIQVYIGWMIKSETKHIEYHSLSICIILHVLNAFHKCFSLENNTDYQIYTAQLLFMDTSNILDHIATSGSVLSTLSIPSKICTKDSNDIKDIFEKNLFPLISTKGHDMLINTYHNVSDADKNSLKQTSDEAQDEDASQSQQEILNMLQFDSYEPYSWVEEPSDPVFMEYIQNLQFKEESVPSFIEQLYTDIKHEKNELLLNIKLQFRVEPADENDELIVLNTSLHLHPREIHTVTNNDSHTLWKILLHRFKKRLMQFTKKYTPETLNAHTQIIDGEKVTKLHMIHGAMDVPIYEWLVNVMDSALMDGYYFQVLHRELPHILPNNWLEQVLKHGMIVQLIDPCQYHLINDGHSTNLTGKWLYELDKLAIHGT